MTEVIELIYKSASLNLCIWSEGFASMSDVYSKDRGKGHATALLQILAGFADERKIRIFSHIEPYDNGLNTEQLKKMYKKAGFTVLEENYIERIPR